MPTDDVTEFYRAFGRLEAEIAAVKESLEELKAQLKDRHSRRWTAYAGFISAVVSTVMAAVTLTHFGIHN